MTEPGEITTVFTIFGATNDNGNSWLIAQVNIFSLAYAWLMTSMSIYHFLLVPFSLRSISWAHLVDVVMDTNIEHGPLAMNTE